MSELHAIKIHLFKAYYGPDTMRDKNQVISETAWEGFGLHSTEGYCHTLKNYTPIGQVQ